ncbi:DUF1758 domain-containing protein [Trichonephila inaurata madagascariensis]|uniref:DUF1758 domain-containing protein n=1 Tax=Trichonephila inaurata madagascariensis TaxID=2747483 RepID=A0A8X6XLN7_9ARAC|nr:DUF1758 domain-containing protein [Trichonephila inaurata madagascariensis]
MSEEQKESIKVARGRVKASLTRLENGADDLNLKNEILDEPVSLIKHIPLSNESYEEAWGKLIDRYNKKKQIVYALIKTFLDQKDISQVNMTNLRNLVHTSDKVLRGLKTLGTEAMNRDPRVLLDSGSESSFISENAINILGLKRCNDRLFLSGISGIQAGTTRGSVGSKIWSRFCEDQLTIKAYILNKVTSQISIERVNIKELDYLKGIP